MYDITASVTNDEDFEMTFTVVDESDTERDITDWTFDFSVNDSDGTQLLTEASTGVTLTKDVPNSTVTIVILASNLIAYECGDYQIACRYTDDITGRIKQLFCGTLKIEEGGFN